MKHKQIAIQYPTFQDFYREAQEIARRSLVNVSKHERIYGIIREVFMTHRLTNDVQFVLSNDIDIKVVLTPADKLSDIDLIAKEIGLALVAARFRNSPEPATSIEGAYKPWKCWQWWKHGEYCIFMQADIPLEGTADYMVVAIPETVTTNRYKLIEREDQSAGRTAA